MTHPGTTLIVDDDSTLREVVDAMLSRYGFVVEHAADGQAAQSILEKRSDLLNAVILDRNMPGMSGLDVISWMQQQPQMHTLPVIMLTGANRPEEIQEGIDAGVFYYLTKPVEHRMLLSVVEAAVAQHKSHSKVIESNRGLQQGITLLHKCRMEFATLEEAEITAFFLAKGFADPKRSMPGLLELCTNAIEHGNLDIGYNLKSNLLATKSWEQEILTRQSAAEFKDRKAVAVLEQTPNSTRVQITDEGNGFDWQNFLSVNVHRALDAHGRGIALANQLSFDALSYNKAGNQVTVTNHKKGT